MAREKYSLWDMESETAKYAVARAYAKRDAKQKVAGSSLDQQFEVLLERHNRSRTNKLMAMEQRILGRRDPVSLAYSKAYDHGGRVETNWPRPGPAPAGIPTVDLTWQTQRQILEDVPSDIRSFSVEPFSQSATELLPAIERAPHRTDMVEAKSAVARRPAPENKARPVERSSRNPPDSAIQVGEPDFDDEVREISPPAGQSGDVVLSKAARAEQGAAREAAADTGNAEPADPKDEEESPHAVFDRMGRNMQFSNTFSLGKVEIDRLFSEFEKELRQEETRPRVRSQSREISEDLDIDDIDLIGELALLSDSLSGQDQASSGDGAAATEKKSVSSPNGDRAGNGSRRDPGEQSPAGGQTAAVNEDSSRRAETGIVHEVPLIPARPDLSPAEASAAMIIAWRDGHDVKLDDLLAGKGLWAPYRSKPGGSPDSILSAWGLRRYQAGIADKPTLARLLRENGPLWIGFAERDGQGRVITGLEFDADTNGWVVSVNDPLGTAHAAPAADNAGRQYTVKLQEFLKHAQNEAERPVVVAHV